MFTRVWLVALGVFCVALVSPAAGSQSSNRFEGRLVGQDTGDPIEGAMVSIVGVTGSARTDKDGRFSWEPAPTPPFQVIVVLPGGQVARPVFVEQRRSGVTTIAVNSFADESVTVIGAAPSVDAPPAAGTAILSRAQIAQRSPETLMQALETVPGVNQVSEGHAAVPAVRGLARGRTLVLVDGARVSAERRVGPNATFLDPSIIDGIDISRGPGSVAYGSDALGGVISVRTRRAEPGSPLRGKVTGTFGAGVPDQRGAFEVSKGLPRGGVLAQVHLRNVEDYDGPDGEVFNSGWEDRGFLLHANHQAGPGLLSIGWQSDFARDVERPRNNSRTVRFYNPFEDSHRLTGSYEVPNVGGFSQITLTGFLGSNEQRTDQDRFPTTVSGRGIERADVSAKDFHIKGIAERLVRKTRLEVGVDVNGRFGLEALDVIQTFDLGGTLTGDTTTVSIDNAHRIDTGMFAQAESTIGARARLSGGVRVDQVTSENVGGFFGDRSTTNTAGAGFGAVTVGPFEGVSVTAQLSRGFRDPVLSDRYFRGPSGRGFITGNPDLEPETTIQFDLAARYTLPHTQLAAYFYQYRITDLIERYQTDPDFFFFRNRGRARLRGFELEARSAFGRGYSVELGTQLSTGVALDDDADLDDVSPATFSVLGRRDIGDRGYGQIRFAVYAKDDRPGPSEVAAPGATLLDIGAGWRIVRYLELRGIVRNLLNDSYYASPDPRWVYAPGRSASLTAVLELE